MSEIAIDTVTPGQASDAPQSTDSVSSFSFSGLHEKALAQMESGSTPEGEHAQTTDPTLSGDGNPAQAENVDNASASQLAQLKDTDLVEVTVDGAPVQMPWSEARGGVMRQAKFTKEMTTLREQERAFNENRQAYEQDRQNVGILKNLLQDPGLLRQFLLKQHPDLLQAANTAAAAEAGVSDPDDIATVGQLEAIKAAAEAKVQEVVGQLTQQLKNHEAQITANLEDRAATVKLANEINTTVKSLFEANPHIAKVIPDAEDLLRWKVNQMQPRTEAEALDAFKTVFGGWVEQFESTVRDTNKQTVLTKQKLVGNNIQPPGGSGPQPTPTNYQKTNPMTGKKEINWDVLRDAASSMLGK